MVNIYDTANQLESDLRKTSQYTDLKEVHEKVMQDEEAQAVLTEFQNLQQSLHEKQHAGEEISEEEASQAQVVSIKMSGNELTTELMEKEQALNELLTEVNQVMMKPIQEIYEA